MEAAKTISNWSPDPSSQIGAIAISQENLPLAWGWNAFPRKVTSISEYEVTREVKYKYVIHAECNVIYNATRGNISLKNTTLFVYGIPPCLDCAKAIVQVGISRVVTFAKRSQNSKWLLSYQESVKLFQEVGIESEVIYEEQN